MQLIVQNGDERAIVLNYILLFSLGSFSVNGNASMIKQFIVIKVISIILLIYE